ncbi:MAG: polyprenyl synthetase family protein [Candidatus Aminicenantes bacterium]|nr:polyprenyl synthetase family protein [Candidatus Aminicenantes bacterium]
MTGARERLDDKRRTVEGALDAGLAGEDSVLLRAMRHAVLSGGKRFRPLLLLCSAERFDGGRGLELSFACGIELIHNYSLVHDDLPAMDDDDLRRGRPSVHKAFGESVAILAGDALLTLAFEVMAGAACPDGLAARKAEAMVLIARAAGLRGMLGGQALDIGFRPGNETEAAYEELTARKTGALIAAAAEAGAVLGGAPEGDRARFAAFGKTIGLAFQLRDDLDDAGQEDARAEFRPNEAAFLGAARSRAKLAGLLESALTGLEASGLLSEELRALALSLEPPG